MANSKGTRSETTRECYRPSKSAYVSIRDHDHVNGPLFDAHVDIAEVRRIARLGQISEDQVEPFADVLNGVLVVQAIGVYDKKTGQRYTRRQLLDRLSKLASSCVGASKVSVDPLVVEDLMMIEKRRLVEERIGRIPIKITFEEIPQKIPQIRSLLEQAARRVKESLDDPSALHALALEAHRAVSARAETTQEYFAQKRALRDDKSRIADATLGFWTNRLGRPAKVTGSLIAVADGAYRLCGFEMKSDAVKRQLHDSASRRRHGAD